MTKFLTATLALAVCCAAAAVQERCIPLKKSEQARLETYIRKKFKVAAATAIQIGEAQDASCGSFRKLEVKSVDPAKRFQLTLYASPDLRFLTRDLLDTRVDPEIEERKKQELFRTGLTSGEFPTLGRANAPVTIAVFSDFQCPYCARFAQMLRKDVLPREGGDVRVVFRQFPLQMHAWARPAAIAQTCVAQESGELFWKIHDYLFDNQRDFTAQNVSDKIAAQAGRFRGFDRNRFQACLNDAATAAKVDRDVAFGSQNGVTGTPTMFVNTHKVSVSEPEQLLSVIREAKAAR